VQEIYRGSEHSFYCLKSKEVQQDWRKIPGLADECARGALRLAFCFAAARAALSAN